MIIKLEQFNGMLPRVVPHMLPPTFAQTASNCKMVSGALEPWRDNYSILDLIKVNPILSLHWYEDTHWFNWAQDINCVRGPIAADAYKRAYWTDGVFPKYTVTAQQTGPDYPTDQYRLGIPAGNHKLTLSQSGTATTTDKRLYESRAYVFTYVSAYGEEGPPSTPSNILTWIPGKTVAVANLGSSPPAGDYNITLKRIYRTNKGTNGTFYQLVAEIPVATSSYNDTIESAALGQVLPSTYWDAPPTGLKGVISLPCGALCGFTDNKEICFSEPWRPHAWPVEYRIPIEDRIVGIGAFGSSIGVLTKGFPVVISGEAPGKMSKEKIEIGEICLSKRGIVDMGYFLMYPSPDGLAMLSASTVENATKKVLSRDDWALYGPSTITAFNFRGSYVGFYTQGVTQAGFVFNPETGDFSELDFYATAGYSDPDSGSLYLVLASDNNLYKFDTSGTAMTAVWKSRPYFSPSAVNMGAAQVYADSYGGSITFKLYGDGTLRKTTTVTSDAPFRLPGGYASQKWEVYIETDRRINRVYVAQTIDELKQARAQ